MARQDSIAVSVRKKLAAKPGLREYLAQGIVNVTALSRKLSEDIGGKENIQAIVSAVKRFRYDVEREGEDYERKMQKLMADCTVSMTSDVAIITMAHPIDWRTLEKHVKIKHVTEGELVTNIVVDEKSVEAFNKIGLTPIAVRTGLAAITMRSNADFVSTPGAMIYLLSPVSYAGINIEETLSCFNEKILILKMSDANRAFNLLMQKIDEARKATA